MALTTMAADGCRREGLPHHYENPSAMIDVFEDEQRDEWQHPERVIRATPIPSKSAIIADIGAGSGYFTRRLADEVPEGKVYAVDVDSEFQRHLSQHRESWGAPNIELHLAHYDDPMLPREQLDLVFTSNTYSFIRERPEYFRKVHQALKPGGHLVVIDYRKNSRPPSEAAPEPQYRVAEQKAIDELKAAGFALERQETFLPHQWFLILKKEG